jgi:hypothetical protein
MEPATLLLALLLLASIAALVLAARAGTAARRAGDDGDGSGDDGGNLRPATPPRAPSGAGDPPWWPDFERKFEDYVQRAPSPSARTDAGGSPAQRQDSGSTQAVAEVIDQTRTRTVRTH